MFIFVIYGIPFIKCLLLAFLERECVWLFIAPWPLANWLVFMDDAGYH